jgi:hypothetical protein
MMSRGIVAMALSLGIAAFFVATISFAAENHVAEAIEHLRSVTNHGGQGQATIFVDEAKIAL